MLAVPGIVLSPTILIQTAGGSDAYLMWAVCTALTICGITTAARTVRVGRRCGARSPECWSELSGVTGLHVPRTVAHFQGKRVQ